MNYWWDIWCNIWVWVTFRDIETGHAYGNECRILRNI